MISDIRSISDLGLISLISGQSWAYSEVAFRGSRRLIQLTGVTVLRGAVALGAAGRCTNFHICIEQLCIKMQSHYSW